MRAFSWPLLFGLFAAWSCEGMLSACPAYGADCALTLLTAGPPRVQICTDVTATSVTLPANWNPGNNKVETYAGGAGGSLGGIGTAFSAPGGGAAYTLKNNAAISGQVGLKVGAGSAGTVVSNTNAADGGDSYVCNATSNCASIGGSAVVVGSKGGQHGVLNASGISSGGGLGGQASAGVGDTKFSGGNGGVGNGGGAGAGAAGPLGAGANGGQSVNAGGKLGGGGGGNGGGSAGQAGGTTAPAGNGGNNQGGTGGGLAGTSGSPNGANGTNGGGGGGGDSLSGDSTAGSGGNGTDGGNGVGSGGGGGASGTFLGHGGAGGLYGGGAGTDWTGQGTVGSGANGMVMFTDVPLILGTPHNFFFGGP